MYKSAYVPASGSTLQRNLQYLTFTSIFVSEVTPSHSEGTLAFYGNETRALLQQALIVTASPTCSMHYIALMSVHSLQKQPNLPCIQIYKSPDVVLPLICSSIHNYVYGMNVQNSNPGMPQTSSGTTNITFDHSLFMWKSLNSCCYFSSHRQ